MNQTIAISAFAGMLSRQSGYTEEFCEHFVAEMFKTVADALKENEEVSIKGLGRFVADNDGNVTFIPDDSFAAEVNAPFDCFEPEPLDDNVTEDILSANINDDPTEKDDPTAKDITVTDEPIPEDPITVVKAEVENQPEIEGGVDNQAEIEAEIEAGIEAEAVAEIEGVAEVEIEAGIDGEAEAEIEAEIEAGIDKQPEAEGALVEQPETESYDAESTEPSDSSDLSDSSDNSDSSDLSESSDPSEVSEMSDLSEPAHNKSRFSLTNFIFGVAVGAIVGGGAVYFMLNPSRQPESASATNNGIEQVATEFGDDKSLTTDDTVSSDSSQDKVQGSEVNAAEEDFTYDYVKSSLSDLSRKHFGSYEFWVYIYEENRDVIPNPDRVEPNTRVRIPNPEKYGINAHDKKSINDALKKAQEISLERNAK